MCPITVARADPPPLVAAEELELKGLDTAFVGLVCILLRQASSASRSSRCAAIAVSRLQLALAVASLQAVLLQGSDMQPLVTGHAAVHVLPQLRAAMDAHPSDTGAHAATATVNIFTLALSSKAIAAAVATHLPLASFFRRLVAQSTCVQHRYSSGILVHSQMQLPFWMLMRYAEDPADATMGPADALIGGCLHTPSFGAWLLSVLWSPLWRLESHFTAAVFTLSAWAGLQRSDIPWNAAVERLLVNTPTMARLKRVARSWAGPQPPRERVCFPVECVIMLLAVAHRTITMAPMVCGIIADMWHLADTSVRADVRIYMGNVGAVQMVWEMVSTAQAAEALEDTHMYSCMLGMHMMCRMLASAPDQVLRLVVPAMSAVLRTLESLLRRSATLGSKWLCLDSVAVATAMRCIDADGGGLRLLVSIACTVHKLQRARLVHGAGSTQDVSASLQLIAGALASWRRRIAASSSPALTLELCGYMLLPALFSRLCDAADASLLVTPVRILHGGALYQLTCLPDPRGDVYPVPRRLLLAAADASLLKGVEVSSAWCHFLSTQDGADVGQGAGFTAAAAPLEAPTWDGKLLEGTCAAGAWRGCAYLRCRNLSGDSELALKTRKCRSCECAHYCSEGCQRRAWRAHKPACQALAATRGQMGELGAVAT